MGLPDSVPPLVGILVNHVSILTEWPAWSRDCDQTDDATDWYIVNRAAILALARLWRDDETRK